MRRHVATAGAIALSFVPQVVSAETPTFETKSVSDRPTVNFDPGKAYILVESTKQSIIVLARQLTTAAEEKQDKDDRAAAFTAAHVQWTKKMKEWERYSRRDKMPIEPIEQTFPWPSYEQRHQTLLGPQNRFSKDGASVYLQEVPPGRYVFYSKDAICACMGSVAFIAEAGKVTVLGSLHFQGTALMSDKVPESNGLETETVGIQQMTSATRDPRLPSDKLTAARFIPVGRLDNWSGSEIDRIMPIAGVFRYDRDKQVDLRN